MNRALAVSVNGRIRAVGHSFVIPGRTGEYFSILVPDASFVQGANDVRLYSVSGPTTGPRLALLGRV
jgi:hypothetical protein